LRNHATAVRAQPTVRRTVLVVDDDDRILKAYGRMLGSAFDVMMAQGTQEAIDLLSSGSNADALVTELSLPDVDGRALFEWLVRERPKLAASTVFVAADATRERYAPFLSEIKNSVLTKPVAASDLWAALDALVSATTTKSSLPPPG
jgi:DNA-binding NtrC family response regulator